MAPVRHDVYLKQGSTTCIKKRYKSRADFANVRLGLHALGMGVADDVAEFVGDLTVGRRCCSRREGIELAKQ